MSTMTEIVARTRSLLYGQGIGEKPTIVLAPSAANETSIGTTVVFDLATAELAKVQAGDNLSVLGAADATGAHSVYVMSKNSTSVTALSSYMGAPAVAADGDLDGAVFELNSLKSEHFLWQAAESVISTLLWPEVFKYNTYAVTPDLSDYQVDLNAAVESIQGAYQVWAGERINIDFEMRKNVHTSVSATGVLGVLYAVDGSSVYLTTRERWLEADTMSEALKQCVATGAAAIALGASRSSTDLESAKKDSQFRGQRNPADAVWRDFVTLRSALAADVAVEEDMFEIRR